MTIISAGAWVAPGAPHVLKNREGKMTKTLDSVAAGLFLILGVLSASAQEPQVNGHTAVTLTGCAEREADYRTRTGAAGVGSTNEIVLSGAHTASEPAKRVDYSLTGKLEPQLIPRAGSQVEVVGFVEDAATHESPGHPATLPRLFITQWQAIGGVCPLP
jgi:hypothetical protein